ncbi:hypothetical protein [Aeromicrobium sp. CTD01-1L150]|uniref:hypothetical protein n=1 Tax=Aeromicrobium sp. CTD01-1L150 TaxID=3341830 RepID=UPI0035BFE924
MSPEHRPSRAWYGLAAVLLVIAVAVGVFGTVRLFTGIANFEIDPVPASGPVTLGERPLAVWQEGSAAGVTCTATNESGAESSRDLRGSTTFTRGSRTWHKVTVIEGPPGSTHLLSCTGASGQASIGVSDDPDVWGSVRDVAVVVLVSGLSAVTAVVVTIVVALRRRRTGP